MAKKIPLSDPRIDYLEKMVKNQGKRIFWLHLMLVVTMMLCAGNAWTQYHMSDSMQSIIDQFSDLFNAQNKAINNIWTYVQTMSPSNDTLVVGGCGSSGAIDVPNAKMCEELCKQQAERMEKAYIDYRFNEEEGCVCRMANPDDIPIASVTTTAA